jgi:hypothetical protein
MALARIFYDSGEESKTIHYLDPMQFKISYTLTPWNTVLIDKLVVAQLVQKIVAFYNIRYLITTLCPGLYKFSLHHSTLYKIHFNIIL